jgi:hypothetical protein
MILIWFNFTQLLIWFDKVSIVFQYGFIKVLIGVRLGPGHTANPGPACAWPRAYPSPYKNPTQTLYKPYQNPIQNLIKPHLNPIETL